MKKTMVLFFVAMLIFQSSIYADSKYSDVSEGFWAYPYIQKMTQLKVVSGYSNGKYGPNDNVSKYAAVLVTYKTLDSQGLIPENEKIVYKNRYQAAISKYNVPNWNGLHEAIGFFIEQDIMKPEELESFQKSGKHVDITRQQMSLFLGKALNIYFKDNINDIIIPKFKDHADIEFAALKYVNILNNHNIISGDEVGYFNPKSTLTRAQLAKMLSTAVDELKNIKTVEDKSIRAVIKVKLDDTKHVVFYDVNSTTKSYREKINDQIKITLDGKEASYEDLKLDMLVDLKYNNEKLVGISAQKDGKSLNSLELKGTVSTVVSATDGKRYIYINMASGDVKFYELKADAIITSNAISARFDEIKKDDVVEFSVEEGLVKEIRFKKKNTLLEGVLSSITIEQSPKLSIKIAENTKEFAIHKDVVIEKNGVKKALGDLSSGDIIKIELLFNEIVMIKATGSENKEVGYIQKVVLASPNQLVIKDAGGKEKTFNVRENVIVYLDSKLKSLHDLRINYMANLTLENEEITQIDASVNIEKTFAAGKIVNKYEDVKVLIIEMKGSNYTLNTKENTLFLDAKGSKTGFHKLQIGDKVFAYGVIQDKIMSAEKVFMLD